MPVKDEAMVDLGRIVLDRGRSVQVTVLDAAEQPVEDATLRLGEQRKMLPATGRFLFTGLPVQALMLEVNADGFLPVSRQVGAHEQEVLVVLERGATVDLSAVGLDGQLIDQAQVCLFCEDGTRLCQSNEDDPLQGVPAGSCQAMAYLEGSSPDSREVIFRPETVWIPETGTIEVEVTEVEASASLRLFVTDERGQPIRHRPRVLMGEVPEPATSEELFNQAARWPSVHPSRDADGTPPYVFELAPGTYTVQLFARADGELQLLQREVSLSDGEVVEETLAVDPVRLRHLPLSDRE